MHNEDSVFQDSVFKDIIVAPTPQELSEDFPPVPEVSESVTYSTADLVAIYSLIKAGYTAEDFA